jgi:hypothetical protein
MKKLKQLFTYLITVDCKQTNHNESINFYQRPIGI